MYYISGAFLERALYFIARSRHSEFFFSGGGGSFMLPHPVSRESWSITISTLQFTVVTSRANTAIYHVIHNDFPNNNTILTTMFEHLTCLLSLYCIIIYCRPTLFSVILLYNFYFTGSYITNGKSLYGLLYHKLLIKYYKVFKYP